MSSSGALCSKSTAHVDLVVSHLNKAAKSHVQGGSREKNDFGAEKSYNGLIVRLTGNKFCGHWIEVVLYLIVSRKQCLLFVNKPKKTLPFCGRPSQRKSKQVQILLQERGSKQNSSILKRILRNTDSIEDGLTLQTLR